MYLKFVLLGITVIVILFIYKLILPKIDRKYRLYKLIIKHKRKKEKRRLERLLKQNLETVKKLEIK